VLPLADFETFFPNVFATGWKTDGEESESDKRSKKKETQMRKRDMEREKRNQGSSQPGAEGREMFLIMPNPDTYIKQPFIDPKYFVRCLIAFLLEPKKNCPQLKKTRCFNRAVIKCFARYLLREGLLVCTVPDGGQFKAEDDLEGRLMKEFLGMRFLLSEHPIDLNSKKASKLLTVVREDGENDECYARENGICCYGIPPSGESGESQVAGSPRKAK
jgi:hypothetical protein